MPLLYRFVQIGKLRHTAETYLGLYNALQRPRIAHVVVEIHIKLERSRLCERRNSERLRPQSYRRCTCFMHDSALGNVILSLRNLRTLTILCTLCDRSHGHEYLFKLNSPALRQFTLSCYGSFAFGMDLDDRSVLIAPFMAQLTALSLQCEQTRPVSRWDDRQIEQLLRDTDALAQLDTLIHYGSRFFNCLLSRRPVKRLHLVRGNLTMVREAIRGSPGMLTQLLSYDLIHWLPREMARGIGPYSHLKFIGTLMGIYRDVGPILTTDDTLN